MSFKRFVFVPVVLVLVAGCGETSLEPTTPEGVAANARGAPGPSASGSGAFIDDSDSPGVEAALRNFGFTAFDDGGGQTQVVNRHVGLRLHGSVECVSVAGDKAWIAFTVTQTSNPTDFEIGHTRGFRVVDNGKGKSGALDQIARSVRVPFNFRDLASDPQDGQEWCDQQREFGFLPLFEIEVGGNITVRP